MERGVLADNLRTMTLERRKEQQKAEDRLAHEEQLQVDEMVAVYVAQHKEPTIDQLATAAMTAAENGQTTASTKIVEPIEKREGLYQMARDVRDYFRQEGFSVEMETYENGYTHRYGLNSEEQEKPTECVATLTISWNK